MRSRERGVGFPLVFEAVECVELNREHVGMLDEFREHATSIDRVELAMIADEDGAPVVALRELRVLVEELGVDHAGFVDDHHRPGPKPPSRVRWLTMFDPFGVMFVDEFVERVRWRSGTGGQLFGSSGRRSDTEHLDTRITP